MGDWVFGRLDTASAWSELAKARVNYAIDEVDPLDWKIDVYRHTLPPERPGPPEHDRSWDLACLLVRDYEFSPPELVRALYDPAAPLLGRNMLLEARFHGMHFYCGVRVTEVHDELRDHVHRVAGWTYEALDGHIERGKVTYEVAKRQDTGEVEFVASCYSQPAPTLDALTMLGWRLFGRRKQIRFYRRCGERLRRFVEATLRGERPLPSPPTSVGRLKMAPPDAKVHRLDILAIHRVAPARHEPRSR